MVIGVIDDAKVVAPTSTDWRVLLLPDILDDLLLPGLIVPIYELRYSLRAV